MVTTPDLLNDSGAAPVLRGREATMAGRFRTEREEPVMAGANQATVVLRRLQDRAAIPRRAWTTDRWGRLLSGAGVVACIALSLSQVPALQLAGCVLAAGVGLELVLTSLFGWCPFHELLKAAGVPDREEVFARELRACAGTTAVVEDLRPRVLESSPVHESDEAVAYDAMVRRYGWMLNEPFVAMVSKRNRDLKRARVLDIGTGPGWIPIRLALKHPEWEFWAVDVSDDMLAQARRNAQAAGVADRIRFVRGGATELPFGEGTFDVVVSHFVLHHLERPEEMLSEARRVAGASGRVMIKDLRRQPAWKSAFLLAFSKHVLRYDEVQMKMYRESIDAALTLEEARAAVARSRLTGASVRGFRGLDWVIAA